MNPDGLRRQNIKKLDAYHTKIIRRIMLMYKNKDYFLEIFMDKMI